MPKRTIVHIHLPEGEYSYSVEKLSVTGNTLSGNRGVALLGRTEGIIPLEDSPDILSLPGVSQDRYLLRKPRYCTVLSCDYYRSYSSTRDHKHVYFDPTDEDEWIRLKENIDYEIHPEKRRVRVAPRGCDLVPVSGRKDSYRLHGMDGTLDTIISFRSLLELTI